MKDYEDLEDCPSPGCPEELTINEDIVRCPMHGPVRVLEPA